LEFCDLNVYYTQHVTICQALQLLTTVYKALQQPDHSLYLSCRSSFSGTSVNLLPLTTVRVMYITPRLTGSVVLLLSVTRSFSTPCTLAIYKFMLHTPFLPLHHRCHNTASTPYPYTSSV
jgi:hypothetical protein